MTDEVVKKTGRPRMTDAERVASEERRRLLNVRLGRDPSATNLEIAAANVASISMSRRVPNQGWIEKLPRQVQLLLKRFTEDGTLPRRSRLIDLRFWEARACGFDARKDLIWFWFRDIHHESRRLLLIDSRKIHALEGSRLRKRYRGLSDAAFYSENFSTPVQK